MAGCSVKASSPSPPPRIFFTVRRFVFFVFFFRDKIFFRDIFPIFLIFADFTDFPIFDIFDNFDNFDNFLDFDNFVNFVNFDDFLFINKLCYILFTIIFVISLIYKNL